MFSKFYYVFINLKSPKNYILIYFQNMCFLYINLRGAKKVGSRSMTWVTWSSVNNVGRVAHCHQHGVLWPSINV